MTFWGIDTEASATGTERATSDIHTIQVCSNRGEDTGKVFWNAEDFKEWYRHKKPRPEIFYSFTLCFEYGTLAAWELLRASDKDGNLPWQSWADEPINLFYITIDHTKIPIYDIRTFFFQLRYGNDYLTNLKTVSHYLSDFYKEDIHKLQAPLGEDFGKRAPTNEEKPYFEKYGIRDAYINAKGAQWIHENVLEKWLKNTVNIKSLYSWGTVAKHYFNLPKIATINHYGKHMNIKFPNQWHKKIFENTFAGRSEAFYTGNIGQCYYNDVSALYPTCIIKTQCLLIKDVTQYNGNYAGLHGKISSEKFYEETGFPYGWILGEFKTENDLWAIPIKVGDNNWYVTGTLKNQLYNTLDLEASNAEVLDIQAVLIPVFTSDTSFLNPMRKYEELTEIKLSNKYESQIEEYCIKSTINSTSGILGKSHPNFGATTNIPAYNIMLGQSHLFMSQIFHQFHTEQHPIFYTDTDSFFWYKPVEQLIQDCEPYPTLPFQVLETVPLKVGVKGESTPEGTVIFRGKMYWQSDYSLGFSAWKPFPQFFKKIIREKPVAVTVERQISRKWRTRDKNVTALKIGRWFIKSEQWDLEKLKQIFRADDKRHRASSDSYQLFLDGKSLDSRAWTVTEANDKMVTKAWNIKIK
jgi:hypothetical protein